MTYVEAAGDARVLAEPLLRRVRPRRTITEDDVPTDRSVCFCVDAVQRAAVRACRLAGESCTHARAADSRGQRIVAPMARQSPAFRLSESPGADQKAVDFVAIRIGRSAGAGTR